MAAKDLPQKLFEFDLRPEWKDKRLKEVLREALPDLGSRHALLAIRNGLVHSSRGDVLEDADTPVQGGFTVDLRHGIHGKGKASHPHLHERMKVLHDDEHVVVVSKRSGTPVQPTHQEDKESGTRKRTAPLVELLKHYWRANKKPTVNPVVIQRLDMGTSGMLVMGKTVEAGRQLQRQLRPPRKLQREYMAIAAGNFETAKGVWQSYIAPGRMGLRQSISAPGGRPPRNPKAQHAITHFEVVQQFEGFALLRLKLETGRTHQIRIHCAEAGHPLLGETVYTRLAENILDRLAKQKLKPTNKHPYEEAMRMVRNGILKPEIPKRPAPRLALHCFRLSFIHPGTKKRKNFEETLPDDLQSYIEKTKA